MTRTALATNAQVLQTARFNSEDEVGGSEFVDEAVDEAEAEVGSTWGDTNKRARFTLLSTYATYEFRNSNIKTYRIDTVLIREEDNDRRVYTKAVSPAVASESAQTYTWDDEFNTITFAAATISAWDGYLCEIVYVPVQIHHLVRLKAALSLLDASSLKNADESMPVQSIRLMSRIKRLEKAMVSPTAEGSSNNANYNPTDGDLIPQRRFNTY